MLSSSSAPPVSPPPKTTQGLMSVLMPAWPATVPSRVSITFFFGERGTGMLSTLSPQAKYFRAWRTRTLSILLVVYLGCRVELGQTLGLANGDSCGLLWSVLGPPVPLRTHRQVLLCSLWSLGAQGDSNCHHPILGLRGGRESTTWGYRLPQRSSAQCGHTTDQGYYMW